MNKKELFKKDFARIRRKIEKFNNQLAEYIAITGDNEVPDIDCTIIGTSPMEPIQMKELRDSIAYCDEGWWEKITVEHEAGEYWVSGEDELDDLLKYNRRRLRKGMRVWKSENPDTEMEKEDEE